MNKTSVKHTATCGAFLLGLAVLLLIASYLYRPRDNTKEGGMNYISTNGYLGEADGTVDVFFVGSSEVYSGICPMRLWDEAGITSYDVATGSQRMNIMTYYVEQILKTHHPKVIVLDAYVIMMRCNPDNVLFTEASKVFPILENHENWKRFDWNMITSPVAYTNREINKGFRPRGAVEQASFNGFMRPSDRVASLYPLNRIYLDYIKDLCDKNGVQLAFVALPSPKNWNYPRHNRMQAYADENGLSFVDLNLMVKELNIDPNEDFRDNGDHLNGPGAKKVSVYLAKYFTEQFHLEDHRDDEAYAIWHEDYEKYPEL